MSCSLRVQQEKLTPVFLQLLRDDSRWVCSLPPSLPPSLSIPLISYPSIHILLHTSIDSHTYMYMYLLPTQVRKAAFQSLGPFISTFYVPPLVKEEGEEDEEDSSLGPLGDSVLMDNSLLAESGSLSDPSDPLHQLHSSSSSSSSSTTSIPNSVQLEETGSKTTPAPTPDNFSHFHYWRDPLPKISELTDDRGEDSSAPLLSDNSISSSDQLCSTQKGDTVSCCKTLVESCRNVLCGSTVQPCTVIREAKEDVEEKEEEEEETLADVKDALLAESEEEGMEKTLASGGEGKDYEKGGGGRSLEEEEDEEVVILGQAGLPNANNGFPQV